MHPAKLLRPWPLGDRNECFDVPRGDGHLEIDRSRPAEIGKYLKLFGPGYRYLIFGYPPFIRAFVDETELDLSLYHFDLIVGGEGLSEGLRSHLRQYARSVISSFGASDLEINIAVETS